MIYEPGLKNPCDFPSHHPEEVSGLDKMTDFEKKEQGIKDQKEDSVFSVNIIIMDNIDGVITKED